MTKKNEIEAIEEWIGKILRIGISTATAVMGFGLLLLIFTGKSGTIPKEFPKHMGEIWIGLRTFQPNAYLLLGLFLLILTPFLRVVGSIFSFAKQKDRLYVLITLLVLLIFVAAILIAFL